MMGVQVAARTKNLRIGTAVSLAPFYHPLRLAEEVALLDVLSGGRVNWGAGRGYQMTEFQAFGVPPEDSYPLFRENVQVVIEAWTKERVSFKGRFWQFDDVEVLPKPAQKPHPPVWLAASSAEAINWAGENGFSIMTDPHSSHTQIGEKLAFYRDALARHGSLDRRPRRADGAAARGRAHPRGGRAHRARGRDLDGAEPQEAGAPGHRGEERAQPEALLGARHRARRQRATRSSAISTA